MNCGVAEDGVELGVEVEALAVADAGVEAEAARSFDLCRTAVHGDHAASQSGQARGQRAVATSEVEDSLAWLRREECEDGRAEVGDEAGVARIGIGVPALLCTHFRGVLSSKGIT
jgi:hypothetical protein